MIGRLTDMVRLVKTVNTPISAEMMRYATLWPNINNTAELAKRGLSLRSTEETFRDSLQWMLQAKYLKPEQVPTIAKQLAG